MVPRSLHRLPRRTRSTRLADTCTRARVLPRTYAGCAEWVREMTVVQDFDIIIVGAGLSGIGAAVRLKTECPDKQFAVLEGRAAIGGTWDLFRYPGVRSDSDMFTLGYPFNPWTGVKAMAGGAEIRAYIQDTASKFGIDEHIRFRHRLVRANWSSRAQRWTLDVQIGGAGEACEQRTYRCRFLYLCCGYYSYERAHSPVFQGREHFRGTFVHPQWWPQDLDYTGKRVVVIGSGATAVTLVPAMAAKAAHVTMLQRSPTYVFALPGEDAISQRLRRYLPVRLVNRIVRGKNVSLGAAFYQLCRRAPNVARRILRANAAAHLPKDYPIDTHFNPRYKPWEERLCVVPDGDLFSTLASGKASVVTDTIHAITEGGIRLSSGQELLADVIVSATGLELQFAGGIPISVDDRVIAPKDTLLYKGVLLSGVPNLACAIGYTNASWTLRADISSRYVCRLIRFMDKHGFAEAVARADGPTAKSVPLLNLASGYVQRALDKMPRQGERPPWRVHQNYGLDLYMTVWGRLNDAHLKFRGTDH